MREQKEWETKIAKSRKTKMTIDKNELKSKDEDKEKNVKAYCDAG